jgi:ABC-type sugar transport system ATPase subunit
MQLARYFPARRRLLALLGALCCAAPGLPAAAQTPPQTVTMWSHWPDEASKRGYIAPMNILQAQLASTGGQIGASLSGGTHMPLSRWNVGALPTTGAIQLGIRPEELVLHERDAGGGGAALHGTVAAVEPLGAETLVAVDLDGGAGEVIARLHRDTPARLGDHVALAAPESALYLFDAMTGKAIPGAALQ